VHFMSSSIPHFSTESHIYNFAMKLQIIRQYYYAIVMHGCYMLEVLFSSFTFIFKSKISWYILIHSRSKRIDAKNRFSRIITITWGFCCDVLYIMTRRSPICIPLFPPVPSPISINNPDRTSKAAKWRLLQLDITEILPDISRYRLFPLA